jgi:hypothetical protein
MTDLHPLGESTGWAVFEKETGICEDRRAAARCAELILE